jgi:hypothetical protein
MRVLAIAAVLAGLTTMAGAASAQVAEVDVYVGGGPAYYGPAYYGPSYYSPSYYGPTYYSAPPAVAYERAYGPRVYAYERWYRGRGYRPYVLRSANCSHEHRNLANCVIAQSQRGR